MCSLAASTWPDVAAIVYFNGDGGGCALSRPVAQAPQRPGLAIAAARGGTHRLCQVLQHRQPQCVPHYYAHCC